MMNEGAAECSLEVLLNAEKSDSRTFGGADRESLSCEVRPQLCRLSAAASSASESVHEEDALPFNLDDHRRHRPPPFPVHNHGEQQPKDLDFVGKLFETHTTKESPHYDLSQGTKLAVIFNHERFQGNRESVRRGTERDCAAIVDVFGRMLGFQVERHDDLKAGQISYEMSKIQERNDISCLALFILTHGEENGILHAFDSNYRLDKHVVAELLPEHCPSLAGKPKLIFVQACQGEDVDGGINVTLTSSANRSRHSSADGFPSSSGTYCIPNYADFLVYQASYHGFYAFRAASGSWFIQALCKALRDSGEEEELDKVLKRVSRQVALFKISSVPGFQFIDKRERIPLKQCTLIGGLYLKESCSAPVPDPVKLIRKSARPVRGGLNKEARACCIIA